jgi:hypothetical protein
MSAHELAARSARGLDLEKRKTVAWIDTTTGAQPRTGSRKAMYALSIAAHGRSNFRTILRTAADSDTNPFCAYLPPYEPLTELIIHPILAM